MHTRDFKNLITDVPGISVGNKESKELTSGVTVILPDRASIAAVDIRGGGSGTRDTELLGLDGTVEKVDAIVLSGGSAFGLDAAGGVMAYLRDINRGLAIGSVRVPIVPQAILFDLEEYSAKSWHKRPPYWELGFEAASSTSRDFSLGNIGAGLGAKAGSIKGGLGSSSYFIEELGITVGALVAVNSAGNVLFPETRTFYAWDCELNDEFGGIHPFKEINKEAILLPKNTYSGQNTTLAVIATDAELTKAQARRLAIISQDGLGRAIRPAHTPLDGDIVFSIATGRQKLKDPVRDLSLLGGYASNSLARAIARAVYEAKSINNITAYTDLKNYT